MIVEFDQRASDALSWLLAPDTPGVRYLALRDLLDRPRDDPDLGAACRAAHTDGPIATVLAAMDPAGYWAAPGPGYNPKYRATVWALIMLAQLGAQADEDQRIRHACAYLLDHALTSTGQFTATGGPSGTVDCLQGNLCWALAELGYDDPRLAAAYEWMARSVTGEGVAPRDDRVAPVRYYAGTCGPRFACGYNNEMSCAWGAVKVMLAFGNCAPRYHTPLVARAIDEGVAFLLGTDPALAAYPSGNNARPSRNWWKFGFPVFYVTDMLQNVEVLVRLGYAHDPRLAQALTTIRQKQDGHGRWLLDYGYAGKTWVDFGTLKQPNKWVTLRALRVLKLASV